jgi:transmembrane sensor
MPEEPNQSASKEERLIDKVALDWVIRQDGGLSPKDQDAFFDWLAANPRNGYFFARHQRKWRRLDHLTHWRPEHSEEANPNLISGKRWKQSKRAWVTSLAAAACVALTLLWLTLGHDPDSNATGILPTTGTIASGYQWHQLEDGSIVELNNGAQVEYRFTKDERRLYLLSGTAHFIVAKNPKRPFFVNARGTQLKAVGTAFIVSLLSDSLEVLVTHGIVEIDPPVSNIESSDEGIYMVKKPAILTAGERSKVSLIENSIQPVTDIPTEETLEVILAWKHQILEFKAAPVSQIVESFGRYNAVSISITDPEIRDLPLTAKFRSDNVAGFLRLLELTLPIEVVEQPNGDLKLSKKL